MQTGSSETLFGWKSGKTSYAPLWDRIEGARTEKKKTLNFPHIFGNSEGTGCKVSYDYRLMVKYLRISSYIIRKPFLIYDFATNPIWIYEEIFFFFFISAAYAFCSYHIASVHNACTHKQTPHLLHEEVQRIMWHLPLQLHPLDAGLQLAELLVVEAVGPLHLLHQVHAGRRRHRSPL